MQQFICVCLINVQCHFSWASFLYHSCFYFILLTKVFFPEVFVVLEQEFRTFKDIHPSLPKNMCVYCSFGKKKKSNSRCVYNSKLNLSETPWWRITNQSLDTSPHLTLTLCRARSLRAALVNVEKNGIQAGKGRIYESLIVSCAPVPSIRLSQDHLMGNIWHRTLSPPARRTLFVERYIS